MTSVSGRESPRALLEGTLSLNSDSTELASVHGNFLRLPLSPFLALSEIPCCLIHEFMNAWILDIAQVTVPWAA